VVHRNLREDSYGARCLTEYGLPVGSSVRRGGARRGGTGRVGTAPVIRLQAVASLQPGVPNIIESPVVFKEGRTVIRSTLGPSQTSDRRICWPPPARPQFDNSLFHISLSSLPSLGNGGLHCGLQASEGNMLV